MNRNPAAGFTLPLIAMLGFAIVILILSIAEIVKSSSHHLVHYNNLNRANRLAESGMNKALGKLLVDASITELTESIPGEGEFYVKISTSANPVPNGYYLMTTATRTANGKEYVTRLHSYALVSNIGEYFAAISDIFILSPGMNAGGGKVYAPNLEFLTTNGKQTVVKSAEYVNSCLARDMSAVGLPDFPPWVAPNVPDRILITDAPGQPVRLPSRLNFPQVSTEDLIRLRDKAGPHTWKHIFEGDIYPPGYDYSGCAADTPQSPDTYPKHTCDNTHHIYYSTENITIRGALGQPARVVGQVLFVSEKNIFISTSLLSFSDNLAPVGYFPGEGLPSSSTAHQAVLIARNNIVITNKFNTNPNPTAVSSMTVQAMFFCPNGSIDVENYYTSNPATADTIHKNLSFIFKGAWIAAGVRKNPNNLPTVFRSGRTYEYMESLNTNPPPYLPSMAEVYYSLEEVLQAPNMY